MKLNYNNNVPTRRVQEEEILGPIKIADGLFLGDQLAARDFEFIMNNRITRIINTSCRSVTNALKTRGVLYLSFNWIDSDQQVIVDDKFDIPFRIYDFIDMGLDKGEAILIHSMKGMNRSVTLMAIFLMVKFKWSMDKALNFLISKKRTIKLRRGFVKQLINFERHLVENKGFQLTTNFETPSGDRLDPATANQELLLVNTYFNSATRFQGSTIAQNNNRLTADLTNFGKFAKSDKKTIRWTQEVRRFIPKKKLVTQKIIKTWEKRDDKVRSMSKPLLKGYVRPPSPERAKTQDVAPRSTAAIGGEKIDGSKGGNLIQDSLCEINPNIKEKRAAINTNAYIQPSQVNAHVTERNITPKVNKLNLTPKKNSANEISMRKDDEISHKQEISIIRDVDIHTPVSGDGNINPKKKNSSND